MALEMNPEIRARWTAALRSGNYEQGHSVLRRGEKRCCLGVLCDLAYKDNVIAARKGSDGIWFYGPDLAEIAPGAEWHEWDETLPDDVLAWAGLDRSYDSPSVVVVPDDGDDPERIRLASLNDNYRWSFAQIADAIDGGA